VTFIFTCYTQRLLLTVRPTDYFRDFIFHLFCASVSVAFNNNV